MRKNTTIVLFVMAGVLALCCLWTVTAFARSDSPEELLEVQEVEWVIDPSGMGVVMNRYTEQMVYYAATGNTDALENTLSARNQIISELSLSYPQMTLQEFSVDFYQYAGFSLDVDYQQALVECCMTGDVDRGRQMAQEWNRRNKVARYDIDPIDFDDLFLLSRVIEGEAGSAWLSVEWKMMTGEVLLNRVASPEFPDTMEECVKQPNQYSGADKGKFDRILPCEDSAIAAYRLMSGERLINDPSVVFQANFPQGSGVWRKLYDERLGYTYLCHSNRMDLYEGVSQ